MQKILISLAAITLVIFAGYCGYVLWANSAQKVPYAVAQKWDNKMELRTYPPLVMAEVRMDKDFKTSGNEAFRLLFDYISGNNTGTSEIAMTAPVVQNQENLKKATNITRLDKIKSDYIRGFEVDVYKLKLNLPDGTTEESTRWITKHGITLKEVGFIEGKEGKIQFYSEFSNVKIFKQDDRLFEVPEGFKIAPIEHLDDVNELLKTMVKRS